MPETTDTHNLVCQRITFALWQILRGKPCKVFMESVKVQVHEGRHYTYPDVFVTCDVRDQADTYIKRHPILIVEVASPSTRVYDKTDKFIAYREIPSLQHYLVVDTERELAECYTRNPDGEWTVTTATSKTDHLPLTALDVTLELMEVYSW
jgi:Uma2 family endonuclease